MLYLVFIVFSFYACQFWFFCLFDCLSVLCTFGLFAVSSGFLVAFICVLAVMILFVAFDHFG